MKKKIFIFILSLSVIFNVMYITGFGADIIETIEVIKGIDISLNGKDFIPKDVNNKELDVFLYQGTTYVPIRAISELYNASVDWDQENRKVILNIANKMDYQVDILRIEQESLNNESMGLNLNQKMPMIKIDNLEGLYNNFAIENNLFNKNALKKYSKKTFETNDVFIAFHTENSGSISLNEEGVEDNKEELLLNISRKVPEIGTMDMAYYVIILTVDKEKAKDKEVFLEISKNEVYK